ncbi:hypothetical protein V2J09_015508 [Rumex salicifolius]
MSSTPLCNSLNRNSIAVSRFPSPLTSAIPSHLNICSSSWESKSRFPFLSVSRCSESEPSSAAPVSAPGEDEWLSRLPDKKKPLYSHSLPCIEAWLRSLGFSQSREDRAVWFIEKPEWYAQLSLDITDLLIRYLKSGARNLEKDVERRFSYALSREDIENAVLGGP